MLSFNTYDYDLDADEKPRMRVIEPEVGNAHRMLLEVLTPLKADGLSGSSRGRREGIFGLRAVNMFGRNGPYLCSQIALAAEHWGVLT